MPDIGDPTLDQLRVLAAIEAAGSFSAAARRLNRAQSVISYTVAGLEAQLGVTLFDRAGRAPVLTEAGRALMEDARRIGAQVDALRARAGALRAGTEAEVALAVDAMFPTSRLVAVLRGFAEAWPTVGLRLRVESLGGVLQAVMEGGCALGVSAWPGAMPEGLEPRVFGELCLLPVSSPSHPLAGKGRIGLEALRDHTQLVLSDSSHFTAGQDFGVLSLRCWRLGDLGARHALLLAGLGWGNMPEPMVADDLAAGRLVRLEIEAAPSFRCPVSLVRRRDTVPGPAACWLGRALDEVGGAMTGPGVSRRVSAG